LKRDGEKIHALVEESAGVGLEEMERILESEGILPEIVARLKEQGGALEGFGKKKHRFF
jgi:hypothetical protein